MDTKAHWENIFTTKTDDQVSWYQPHLKTSLRLIVKTGVSPAARIIDVGGGTSTLVDDLLAQGYHPTVLDISAAALRKAQARLGALANTVNWIVGDITRAELPENTYDIWHDRAVFHFLTGVDDRWKYVEQVKRALKPNGHVIIATFALDGPTRCSNLDVIRYSPTALHDEFGDAFEFVESFREEHETPFGTQQAFIYCVCRKREVELSPSGST